MKISGKIIEFEPGDIIQIIYNEGSSDGTISSDKNQFVAFSFGDITLVRNEEILARGPVNDFRIGGYDSFSSTLNMTMPAGDQFSRLYIDSEEYKYAQSPRISFTGIGPDSFQQFFYQKSNRAMSFRGGVSSYQFS